MSDVFDFVSGEAPLLVSIPHDGRSLAPGQSERMTDEGRALPDTDWHVTWLYEFAADLGATVIAANYSRSIYMDAVPIKKRSFVTGAGTLPVTMKIFLSPAIAGFVEWN